MVTTARRYRSTGRSRSARVGAPAAANRSGDRPGHVWPTGAAPAPTSVEAARPTTTPDTPAARALWAALAGRSGVTTAELAVASGIGRSTAAKLLSVFEAAGTVTREVGGRDRGARRPDRWTSAVVTAAHDAIPVGYAPPSEAQIPSSDCADTPQTPASTGQRPEPPSRPGTSPTGVAAGKLGHGELRGLVNAYLIEHSDEDLTPSAVATSLGRSAGAVANACERLVALDLAARTSPAPRRYRAAVRPRPGGGPG
jgi:hypothetical protein